VKVAQKLPKQGFCEIFMVKNVPLHMGKFAQENRKLGELVGAQRCPKCQKGSKILKRQVGAYERQPPGRKKSRKSAVCAA